MNEDLNAIAARISTLGDQLSEIIKPKTTFACACDGCRNYPPHVSRAYYAGEQYLASVTVGPFFSADAMRFFKSRIAHVALLDNPAAKYAPEDSGIAVIVSNKRDTNSRREYELVIICKWGEITREWDAINSEIVNYPSLHAARLQLIKSARYPVACTCHGCVLDREGR